MQTLTEPEARFIENLGQQAQADGLSRIAGQIWAALIVSDGPIASTLLSIIIVPCLYLLLTRESQRRASGLD